MPKAPADSAARVAGRLWLWPASPRDRSPRTGERPGTGRFARLAARGVAFTGATDAPLDRAGVVLRPGDPDHFPPPTSWDPVYPGLVGRRDGPAGAWQLWVGGTNVRTPRWRMMTDGPGAVLFVEVGDGGRGFAGTWGPIGRAGGRGAFCARYVGPAPQR